MTRFRGFKAGTFWRRRTARRNLEIGAVSNPRPVRSTERRRLSSLVRSRGGVTTIRRRGQTGSGDAGRRFIQVFARGWQKRLVNHADDWTAVHRHADHHRYVFVLVLSHVTVKRTGIKDRHRGIHSRANSIRSILPQWQKNGHSWTAPVFLGSV